MRIVEFNDGTFGIERGFIFKEYADLKSRGNFWWSIEHRYFFDCKGTKEQAEKAFFKYNTKVKRRL